MNDELQSLVEAVLAGDESAASSLRDYCNEHLPGLYGAILIAAGFQKSKPLVLAEQAWSGNQAIYWTGNMEVR